MTTINNAAGNETVETAAVAPVAEVVRNTLKSTLERGDKEALAAVLYNMAGSAANFKVLNETFKEAAKLVPGLFKQAEQEAKAAAEKRANAKAELLAGREADKAAQLAELEKQQAEMLKMMVETMGLDKEAALIACEAALKGKRKAIETASVRPHVDVVVEGVTYSMPHKGNMSQALKDLVTESGLTREAFIEKYQVQDAPAVESEA